MADDVTIYKIQNRWLGTNFLSDATGKVNYGEGTDDTYLWSIENKNGAQRIKNKATGNYMSAKDGSPDLSTAALPDSDPTSYWIIDPVAGDWVSIKSKANGNYINVEAKKGYAECDSNNVPSDTDRWAEQWKLVYVSGPQPAPVLAKNIVHVTAPAYCSDVKGDTTIAILAPGFTSAVVKCWQQGDGFGADSTVGNVTLDADGKGTIVFPADKYPHGPIMVRITGTNGTASDTCNLQLYNKGGVSWNEGIPKDPPPPAEGMKLVYSDDFNGPLSISATGAGATYYSHKPGGGDFGDLHFSDFESANNPFFQVDTYLRIRADATKGYSGLISSLRKDGTGFTTTAPCYFECRFLSQSAPGSWPAFWVMTQGVYKGLKEPADELDIIEAYGGTGPHHPNQSGYWTTSHNWNQPGKQPGVYQQNPMQNIGGKSTWWETFHIYGCKITDTDTIYYCDNIEVARHPTCIMSKTEPFFFFINLAIGGGWPKDLSRYDNIIDMYVDYVRVYKQ